MSVCRGGGLSVNIFTQPCIWEKTHFHSTDKDLTWNLIYYCVGNGYLAIIQII